MTSNNSLSNDVFTVIDRRIQDLKNKRANGKRANGKPLTSTQRLICLERIWELEELSRELKHLEFLEATT